MLILVEIGANIFTGKEQLVMASIKGRKNHRHHPGIKGRRPDHAKFRREEAVERQTVYNLLTTEQKLAQLGPEPASQKQRTKLIALLQK